MLDAGCSSRLVAYGAALSVREASSAWEERGVKRVVGGRFGRQKSMVVILGGHWFGVAFGVTRF